MVENHIRYQPIEPPIRQDVSVLGAQSQLSSALQSAELPPRQGASSNGTQNLSAQSSKNSALAYSQPLQSSRQSSHQSSGIPVDQNEKISLSNARINDITDHDNNYHKVTHTDSKGEKQTLLVGKQGTAAQNLVLREKSGGAYSAHKLDDAKNFYDEANKLRFDTSEAKHLGLVGDKSNQYEQFQLKDGKIAHYGVSEGNKGWGYLSEKGQTDNIKVQKIADYTKNQLEKQIPNSTTDARNKESIQNDIDKDPKLKDIIAKQNEDGELGVLDIKRLEGIHKLSNAISGSLQDTVPFFGSSLISELMRSQSQGFETLAKDQVLGDIRNLAAKDPASALAYSARFAMKNPSHVDAKNYYDHLSAEYKNNKPLSRDEISEINTRAAKMIERYEALQKVAPEKSAKYPHVRDTVEFLKAKEANGSGWTSFDKNFLDAFISGEDKKLNVEYLRNLNKIKG